MSAHSASSLSPRPAQTWRWIPSLSEATCKLETVRLRSKSRSADHVRASSGHIAQVRRTYQEVYLEKGRWYGTYKQGKYMFPIDEVSMLPNIPPTPPRSLAMPRR